MFVISFPSFRGCFARKGFCFSAIGEVPEAIKTRLRREIRSTGGRGRFYGPLAAQAGLGGLPAAITFAGK